MRKAQLIVTHSPFSNVLCNTFLTKNILLSKTDRGREGWPPVNPGFTLKYKCNLGWEGISKTDI